VQWGYSLSAAAKPLMAAFTYPLWIFFVRTIDRTGKGLRTGARDALLSDETSEAHKGRVFGFHRSMDTFGAVLGPLAALVFLYYYPGQYRLMFILAFIPAIFGVGITFILKEKKNIRGTADNKASYNFFSFVGYWKDSPKAYRRLVSGLLAFALVNSSDVFLLLMLKANGLTDVQLILVYIFYNIIYALTSYPIGIVADRLGLWETLFAGLFLFAGVYAGMAFVHPVSLFLLLFAVYGIYAAATEGISKALISNISDRKDTATAIGTYSAFNSLATLMSSSLAGFIWFTWGPKTLFLFAALGSVAVVLYLIMARRRILRSSVAA